MQKPIITLSEQDKQSIMTLGRHVSDRWFHASCAVDLKKKIMRILIKEIIVNLDDNAQECTCMMHWQGGCPPTFSMAKPMSGAVKDKTPAQDIDLSRNMAVRYGERTSLVSSLSLGAHSQRQDGTRRVSPRGSCMAFQ
jgi:hypothetical protein